MKDSLPPDWVMQYSIGMGVGCRKKGYPPAYKVDLALPALKLAIEVDGQSHKMASRAAQDLKKQQALSEKGWTILRFWNHEVLNDTESCLRAVEEEVERLSTT